MFRVSASWQERMRDEILQVSMGGLRKMLAVGEKTSLLEICEKKNRKSKSREWLPREKDWKMEREIRQEKRESSITLGFSSPYYCCIELSQLQKSDVNHYDCVWVWVLSPHKRLSSVLWLRHKHKQMNLSPLLNSWLTRRESWHHVKKVFSLFSPNPCINNTISFHDFIFLSSHLELTEPLSCRETDIYIRGHRLRRTEWKIGKKWQNKIQYMYFISFYSNQSDCPSAS